MKNPPLYQAHPWHGVSIGDDVPAKVSAFVEITPLDTIKYEIDKASGILKVDRPQKYSNIVPALYGFIPQTYCGEEVRKISNASGSAAERGDGDPLDILILTSHSIHHGNILLKAIPIGGISLVDKGEADDKIIAVLDGDAVYGSMKSIADIPRGLLDKFQHYFLTYKNLPNQSPTCAIQRIYDTPEAHSIIRASMEDYQGLFGAE